MSCGLLSNIGIYIFQNMMYNNKANVPADLYGLLSAAKNLPELNIRSQRFAQIIAIRSLSTFNL